jgi:hypothetical protein
MEAWVMDVLENPFVRLRYFLEPHALSQQMSASGLDLYSSWPLYRDALNVYWFKKVLPADAQMQANADFIARSRLSHLFGRKHFIAHLPDSLDASLHDLLVSTDSLIDQLDVPALERCVEYLGMIGRLIDSPAVISEEADKALTLGAIRSTQEVFHLITAQDMDRLVAFCNQDPAFIGIWGTPSHFAVYQLR